MEFTRGAIPVLFLCLVGGVLGTQYCSTVTRGKVTSISCGDNYHCCEGNTKCCRDAGYISNGAVAGIAVGGSVVIVVAICLTVCFVKSRRHKDTTLVNVNVDNGDIANHRPEENAGYDQSNPGDRITIPPPYSENSDNPPKYAK